MSILSDDPPIRIVRTVKAEWVIELGPYWNWLPPFKRLTGIDNLATIYHVGLLRVTRIGKSNRIRAKSLLNR